MEILYKDTQLYLKNDSSVGKTRSESDKAELSARGYLPRSSQLVQPDRNAGAGNIAHILNVGVHLFRRYPDHFGSLADDPQVSLMRDNDIQIVYASAIAFTANLYTALPSCHRYFCFSGVSKRLL